MSPHEHRSHAMPINSATARAASLTISEEELYERVARKAYELYQQRGEIAGHDLNDWFTAERLIRAEILHGSALAKEEGAVVEDETT